MGVWKKAVIGGLFWTAVIIITVLVSTGWETQFIYTRF